MTINVINRILSMSSATGWSAVYMCRSDKSLFTVSLASWALVKGWNEHEWIEDKGNCVIGLVLSSNGYSIIPAAEPNFVKNVEYEHEDPALFCGYLAPGEDLKDLDWYPQWS